ncbi:hypothetical protein [Leptospira wolffii]|uniref:hypothetical protein n=1 Tax=Leptospira wolffii TaxID=409998 RepID=UPI001FF01FAF|nr:hypothetical protein [Leptospira wolffii]
MPTEIQNIEIEYDENYRIRMRLSCRAETRNDANRIIGSLFESSRQPGRKSIIALAGGDYYIAAIRDYFFQSADWRDGKVYATGEVISIKFRARNMQPTDHYAYWYLNGDRQFPYTRTQNTDSRRVTKIQIGGNKSYRLKYSDGFSNSTNHFRFKHTNWNIEVAYSDSKQGIQMPLTSIRFYGSKPPSQKIVDAASSLYSFLCGKELINNGYSFLDRNLLPTKAAHRNSIRNNLSEIKGKLNLYPIPLEYRRLHNSEIRIEELFPSLLEIFVSKFDVLPIYEAIWLINQSRYLPLDIQMQPLATAFDLLKSAWFKKEQSPSSSKYLKSEEYAELLGAEFNVIKKRFKGLSFEEKLISKIESANEMSMNELNFVFLEDIGLKYDLVEKVVIKERNSVVHGSLKPKNYQELSGRTLAFGTLLNRIILKLLSYSGEYIDYSWDNGSELKFYALPIESPMQDDRLNKKI